MIGLGVDSMREKEKDVGKLEGRADEMLYGLEQFAEYRGDYVWQ